MEAADSAPSQTAPSPSQVSQHPAQAAHQSGNTIFVKQTAESRLAFMCKKTPRSPDGLLHEKQPWPRPSVKSLLSIALKMNEATGDRSSLKLERSLIIFQGVCECVRVHVMGVCVHKGVKFFSPRFHLKAPHSSPSSIFHQTFLKHPANWSTAK